MTIYTSLRARAAGLFWALAAIAVSIPGRPALAQRPAATDERVRVLQRVVEAATLTVDVLRLRQAIGDLNETERARQLSAASARWRVNPPDQVEIDTLTTARATDAQRLLDRARAAIPDARWPLDRRPAEYRTLADARLAEARRRLASLRETGEEVIDAVRPAAEVMGWIRGTLDGERVFDGMNDEVRSVLERFQDGGSLRSQPRITVLRPRPGDPTPTLDDPSADLPQPVVIPTPAPATPGPAPASVSAPAPQPDRQPPPPPSLPSPSVAAVPAAAPPPATLPPSVASSSPPPAVGTAIALAWIGKGRDLVGPRSGQPDGVPDAEFKVTLDLGDGDEVRSIDLYGSTAAGQRNDQRWSSADASSWLLGVSDGRTIKPQRAATLGRLHGRMELSLNAVDPGWFDEGNFVLVEVTLGSGRTLVQTARVGPAQPTSR